MNNVSFVLMGSGIFWFISVIILNKQAFPSESLFRLHRIRDFSLYQDRILSETDFQKQKQLKVLSILVIILTINFFIQTIFVLARML